jgi:plastocyanin
MHPNGVASAAWVIAAAHSKAPFYAAAGVLVAWAVLLAITGIRRPDFPGSARRARLVMLTTAVLTGATVTSAVATGSNPAEERKAPAPRPGAGGPQNALRLAADPAGALTFDKKHANVAAGAVAIELVNKSPIPHNVTIAMGARVVGDTPTVTSRSTSGQGDLRPGDYVFYCSVPGHREAGMQGTLTVR